MTSTHAAEKLVLPEQADANSTGDWKEDLIEPLPRPIPSTLVVAALGFSAALGVVPSTSHPGITAPGAFDRGVATWSTEAAATLGNILSLKQARELALRVLKDADRKRVEAAEEEARRMMDLEAI